MAKLILEAIGQLILLFCGLTYFVMALFADGLDQHAFVIIGLLFVIAYRLEQMK